MRTTSILRFAYLLTGGLVVAVAAVALALRLGQGPTTVGAGPSPTAPGPTNPATTVPPTTVPPTTAPPTTAPPTTAPPTTAPPQTAPPQTDGTLRRGDRGEEVRALQERLIGLGYWLGRADGTYGPLVEQAVTAFQKVEGLARDGVAGPATQAALADARRPTTTASGDLVEVDKARQVLLVVRGGAVAWVLNTSTGTEKPYVINGRTELADTPPGTWSVSWVVDGVDTGELGSLYRPRYFHRDGIAVHGYHSVPPYPASHGCVRVTDAAMDWIWANGIMPMGSTVWVH